jgi:cell shape-determining protein MreC
MKRKKLLTVVLPIVLVVVAVVFLVVFRDDFFRGISDGIMSFG